MPDPTQFRAYFHQDRLKPLGGPSQVLLHVLFVVALFLIQLFFSASGEYFDGKTVLLRLADAEGAPVAQVPNPILQISKGLTGFLSSLLPRGWVGSAVDKSQRPGISRAAGLCRGKYPDPLMCYKQVCASGARFLSGVCVPFKSATWKLIKKVGDWISVPLGLLEICCRPELLPSLVCAYQV